MIDLYDPRTTAVEAMRWARQQYGEKLTVDIHRYENGQILYTWIVEGSSDALTLLSTPGRRSRIYALCGANTGRLHTSDTERVLDVLAALGLLPLEFSGMYRRGMRTGQIGLATDLLDARQTYEAVQRSGRNVGRRVMR